MRGQSVTRTLPPEVLEYVRAVYDVIGDYLDTTLEQFEIGFMREATPGVEIALWCCITAAWITYHEQYLAHELQSDEEEKKLLAALLAISAGVEDVDDLGVSADVGEKLMACYERLAK